MDQIERWALFMKNNPGKWKKIHTEFIDAQYDKAYAFYDRLAKTEGGKEKIIKIFGIKNLDGYPSLK
jgi:hypothetical protein